MGIIKFIGDIMFNDQNKTLLENMNKLDHLKKAVKELDKNKDKCVSCDALTPYTKETNINVRNYYVEGGGQLCKECYTKIYTN